MRFETKLGLITIVLLGTTFSFLLYKKIQERKATLANQAPVSTDSNFVNVENTEEKKTPLRTENSTTKKPTKVIAKTKESKPKFKWKTNTAKQSSFAQNDIKQKSPDTQWKSAPKEKTPVTNLFQKKSSSNPFGNSLAAQKTTKTQSTFEVKPIEEKPGKKKETSFDFVKNDPFTKPTLEKEKKQLSNPFAKIPIPAQNKDASQTKKTKIVNEEKPKIEVAQNPFNTPAQKKIKTPAVVQKEIKKDSKFDFASNGNPNPFQVPAQKKAEPEIKIPEEFTQKTPVVKKTEIKTPAFPVDPFTPAQKTPEQKTPKLEIAQKEITPSNEQKKATNLFDDFPEEKQNISQNNAWKSDSLKPKKKVRQKEFFTPNFDEPPKLNVVQNEKPLIPEKKDTEKKKEKTSITQAPKHSSFPDLKSPKAKPLFADSPKQNVNQKPVQVSPFAPLVDQKDPLEGLIELPPTRRLSVPKSTNAQFISLQRTITPKVSAKVHVAQPGDSYWKISKRRYGSAMYFAALGEFNKDRIKDPNRLKPGMKVMIPSAEFLENKYPQFFKSHKMTNSRTSIQLVSSDNSAGFYVSNDGNPMYRVGHEDTLTSIAESHLGRTARWSEIYELNKSRIKNPNRLKVGTELQLPNDASRISVINSSLRFQ